MGAVGSAIDIIANNTFIIQEFEEKVFREIIFDYHFFKQKVTLGEYTLRERLEEERKIVSRIIVKLNKFIKKDSSFKSFNNDKIGELKHILSFDKKEKVLEQLIYSKNIPLVLRDRIIKISFEFKQLKKLLINGIVSADETKIFQNKITNDLLSILDSLSDIESFRYYNQNPMVFVIIAFDEQMDIIYDTIKEIGNNFNLEPVRVKDVIGDYRITSKIIDLINRSKFVIADLSLEKPNVYFELGYARGLEKEIITICNQKTKIHFDVKDWTCLYYSNQENLKRNLYERIEIQIENGE